MRSRTTCVTSETGWTSTWINNNLMIGKQRAKEIAALVEKDGVDKTAKRLNIPKDTVRRYIRRNNEFERPVSPANVLLIDIETAPIIAEVWGLYNQNISQSQIS